MDRAVPGAKGSLIADLVAIFALHVVDRIQVQGVDDDLAANCRFEFVHRLAPVRVHRGLAA